MGAFFEKADQTIDAHNLAIKGRKLAQANERRVYRTHSSKDEREQRNIGNPNSGWGDSGRATDQMSGPSCRRSKKRRPAPRHAILTNSRRNIETDHFSTIPIGLPLKMI